MNPMLQEALGAIIRWMLTFAAGWFVSLGIWSQDKATGYVGALATAVLVLAWSLFQKYKSRIKFLVALSEPEPKTESEVNQIVKNPEVPNPSVFTPQNEVPNKE